MLRFLILSGYFELMMYLQVSGKLDQYINVHYRYLAILSMILSALLAVIFNILKLYHSSERCFISLIICIIA